MDGNHFYGPGMSIELPQSPTTGFPLCSPRTARPVGTPRSRFSASELIPGYVSPSSVERPDIGGTQRFDQVVTLIKEQSNELNTLKHQVESMSAEIQELKTLITAQSSILKSASVSGTPTTASRKLPTQLSV